MKFVVAGVVLYALTISAQAPLRSPPADPLQALAFLEGTWETKPPTGAGSAVPTAPSAYTFRFEAGRHVLARRIGMANCSTAACEAGDALYIYPGGFRSLDALSVDSQGKVLTYHLSAPTSPAPTTLVFLSDNAQSGPRYRLVYSLENGVLTQQFQTHMPVQTEWRTVTQWSGTKHSSKASANKTDSEKEPS